jgi:hypothetical protein
MKRHIINIVGFTLMVIASAIGLASNILTLTNQDSLIDSVWQTWQIIIFVLAFVFTLGLSLFFLTIWIIRLIKDIKIKKE